jgi:hypothetical protein
MKILDMLFRRNTVAALARQGLLAERPAGRKPISGSLQLIAGALGDSWKQLSCEAAAGMVLVALAKDSKLQSCLNDRGWELVLTFVGERPELVRHLSPRALADVDAYQAKRLGALLASAA